MNRDDIIRMAREAGLLRSGEGWTEPHRWGITEIERFANLIDKVYSEVDLANAYQKGWDDAMLRRSIGARGER